jgi:hypothetical protein
VCPRPPASRSVYQLAAAYPDAISLPGLKFGAGANAGLLGVNVVSALCCWGLGALALIDNRRGAELEAAPAAGGGGTLSAGGDKGGFAGDKPGSNGLGLELPEARV